MLFNFNNKKIKNVKFNGVNLNTLRFNGTIVWERNNENPPIPSAPDEEIDDVYCWKETNNQNFTIDAEDNRTISTNKLYSNSKNDGSILYYDQSLKYSTPYTLYFNNQTNKFETNEGNYTFEEAQIVYPMKSALYNKSITYNVYGFGTPFYSKFKTLEVGDKVYRILAHYNEQKNIYDYMGLYLFGEIYNLTPHYNTDFGIWEINDDEETRCNGPEKIELISCDMAIWSSDDSSVFTFSRFPRKDDKIYVLDGDSSEPYLSEIGYIKSVEKDSENNILSITTNNNIVLSYDGTFGYIGPRL